MHKHTFGSVSGCGGGRGPASAAGLLLLARRRALAGERGRRRGGGGHHLCVPNGQRRRGTGGMATRNGLWNVLILSSVLLAHLNVVFPPQSLVALASTRLCASFLLLLTLSTPTLLAAPGPVAALAGRPAARGWCLLRCHVPAGAARARPAEPPRPAAGGGVAPGAGDKERATAMHATILNRVILGSEEFPAASTMCRCRFQV